MEKKMRDELVAKYNEGVADPAEIKQIEELIEIGEIKLTELHELESLNKQIQKFEEDSPSLNLDDRFYAALADEKKKLKSKHSFSLPSWQSLFPSLGVASIILIFGFALGYLIQTPKEKTEVGKLTREVSELKEMMMLSLLEKESASQRLKAVNLTSEMDNVSEKVTNALFTTLNQDENVNVRLAALEALKPYVKNSNVRTQLVESISNQDNPLMQVAMAELMAAIQEKKSVEALKELLKSDRTPKEVKSKISESIQVLI
jgi:hypothetical protein